MSSAVVSPAAFSVSNLTIAPLKVDPKTGRKSAFLNYAGQSLLLQVGSLETPFGMSVFDKDGPVKYSVDLKLRGHDDAAGNPKVAAIYNALNAIDNFMIEQGVDNAKTWFKIDSKEKDPVKRREEIRNIVKAFYTPCARFSRDADGNVKPYPPMLKVQLRNKDGKFVASKDQPLAVYDLDRRALSEVPLQDILIKGAFVTMIIQCTGVWFAGSKFGVSWKAEQLRADKVPETIRGYAFGDEDGESAPAPRRTATAVPTRSAAPVNQFANLADDEEEEDDDLIDDDDALAPAPAPAPVHRAPAPAPAPVMADLDDEPDDLGPIPVPTKKAATITKKKVVAKATK